MGGAGNHHYIYVVDDNHQVEHQPVMVETSSKVNDVKVKFFFVSGAIESFK